MATAAAASAASATTRYKLVFHAPVAAAAACKQAVFAAGAGRYPNYSECAFTVVGTGQFRPGGSANPHIGTAGGGVEEVQEASVETICVGEETARRAVEALKKSVLCVFFLSLLIFGLGDLGLFSVTDTLGRAHPYEEPSYQVYKLEDF